MFGFLKKKLSESVEKLTDKVKVAKAPEAVKAVKTEKKPSEAKVKKKPKPDIKKEVKKKEPEKKPETPPKTEEARLRQKMGSWKHGLRSKEAIEEQRALSRMMREAREFLRSI